MFKIVTLIAALCLVGCVVVPVSENRTVRNCELSTNKKYLKVIDVAKETNSYYSISGILLTPILVPTTAILSGAYVAVNNTYHFGEKIIECKKNST